MKYLFIHIFIYSNIDAIINKFYLPMFHINFSTELITANNTFYYSITKYNEIMLFIYICFVLSQFLYCKSINNYSLATAFIFIKYLSGPSINYEMKLYEYEFSRNVMWLFTTPLLLKMYCNANGMKLIDINIHYHNCLKYYFISIQIYEYILCVCTHFLCFLWDVYENIIYEKRKHVYKYVYFDLDFICMCKLYRNITPEKYIRC